MTAIRFGVGGADSARSSLWRVWSGKKTSDVYVESRDVHGVMKFSLHETGDWHCGYRSEYIRAEIEAGRWRAEETWWDEWRRPQEFTAGFTLALKFVVPREAVRETNTPLPTKKEIRWIPTPSLRSAVVITLTFGRPGLTDPFAETDTSAIVGEMELRSGERVWIHSHVVEGEFARAVMFRSLGTFLQQLWMTDISDLSPFSDDTVLLGFSTDASGARAITECPLQILKDVLTPVTDDDIQPPNGVRFIDVEFVPPRQVFISQNIDPMTDPDRAQRAVEVWREVKSAQIRHLLSF